MVKRNLPLFAGLILMLIAVIYISGFATVILIPQITALFEFFGYNVPELNVWEFYLPLMTLLMTPIILFVFAVFLRRPKQ